MIGSNRAYASLVTVDSYVDGALCLAHSLRSSPYPLVIIHTGALTSDSMNKLANVPKIILKQVESLATKNTAAKDTNAYSFSHFAECWTKLYVFGMTEYETVVFLDSDMLVLQNMDELFDVLEAGRPLAAAPACTCNVMKNEKYPASWTPETCRFSPANPKTVRYFNAGLFVCKPSKKVESDLIRYLCDQKDISGYVFAEQDMLNEYFPNFQEISYKYNALKTLPVFHKDVWKTEEVKNIHYILGPKPWKYDPATVDPETAANDPYHPLYMLWIDAAKAVGLR